MPNNYYTVADNNGHDCGHKHKTYEAAENCREKLQQSYCGHCGKTYHYNYGHHCKCWSWTTSARWYNARIVKN